MEVGFPVEEQPSYEVDDVFDAAFDLPQDADQPMNDASLAAQTIYNDMLDAEQQLGQLAQRTSAMQSMTVEENGDVPDIGSFSSPPLPLPSSEGWCRWREFISYYTGDFTREEPFWGEFIRIYRSTSQLKFLHRNDDLPIDTKELTIEWHANLPIQTVFVLNKKGRMLIGIPSGPHCFCFNHTSSTSVLKSSSRLFTTTNIFVFVVNWNGERRFLSFALYSNSKNDSEARRNIDANQFTKAFRQVNEYLDSQQSAEKKRKRSDEEQVVNMVTMYKQQKVATTDVQQVVAFSPIEKAASRNNYINLFKKVRKDATRLDPAEFAFIFHYLTEYADDRWTDAELLTSLSLLMPSLNQQDQLLDVSSTNLQRFGSLYDCTKLSLDTIVRYGPIPDEIRSKIGEFDYVHVGNKYVACINAQYMLVTHIYHVRQRILSTLKMGSNVVGLLENGDLFVILTNFDQCTTVKSEEKFFSATTTGYLRKVNNSTFLLIKCGQSIENVYWCALNEQNALNITELPQMRPTERASVLRLSTLPGFDKIVTVNKDPTNGSLWLNAFQFTEATTATQFTVQQVAEPYELPTNLDLKSVHLVNECVVATVSTTCISFLILGENGFFALPNSTQLHYRKDRENWSIYSVITGVGPNEIWVCYGFDDRYRFSWTPTIIGYKMDHSYQFDKTAAFTVESEDRLIRSETKLILYRSQANYYHPLRSNNNSSIHYSISDVTSKEFSIQCNDLKRYYELKKIGDDELLVCNGLIDYQTKDFSQALWCQVGKNRVLASNASRHIEITSYAGDTQCIPYPHQLNDTTIIHLHSLGDKALLETVSGALFVLTIREDRFHALMGPIPRDTIYRQKGSSIVFSNQFMIGTRTNNFTMDIMTLIILDGDIISERKRHKALQFAIPKQVQVKAHEKMVLLCSVNTSGYDSFRDGDVSCQYVMANLQHQLTNAAIPTNVSSLFKTKPLMFTKHQDWELYGLCDSLVIKAPEPLKYQRIPISSVIHTAIPIGENHVLACSVDQIFKWNVKENMLEDECGEAWAQCHAAIFVTPSTVVLGTIKGIYVINPNNNLDAPLVFKPFDMEGIQKVQLTTIGTPRPTKTEFLVCTNKAVLKYSYQLVNEHHTIQLRHVYQSPDIHFILQLLPSTECVYFAIRANHNDHPRVVCISGRSGRVCWQSEPLYSITTACANSYYGGTHVVYMTHDRNLVLTRAIIDGSRIQLSTCKKPMSEDIDPCTLQVDSVNKVVILLTIPSDYGYSTVNLDENIENMAKTLHHQVYHYDQ